MRRPSPSPRFPVSPDTLMNEVNTWCEATKGGSSSAKDFQEALGGLEEFKSLGGSSEILKECLLRAYRNDHGNEPSQEDVEQAVLVAGAILNKRARPRSISSEKVDPQALGVAPRRGKASGNEPAQQRDGELNFGSNYLAPDLVAAGNHVASAGIPMQPPGPGEGRVGATRDVNGDR